MFDLVLRGGVVYDGLGSAGRKADVAIVDGRVAAIGADVGAAKRVIDVDGLAVAPGFIDAHCHSDMVAFLPQAQPFKLMQGVTTEINGNCGFSFAPVTESSQADASALLSDLAGVDISVWTFAGYLDALEAAGPTNNVATLVGHGTLRMAVAGMAPILPEGGLEQMCRLAADAFEAGAVGFSTGLIYPPGAFGDVDEIAAIGAVAHAYGRIYTTHMRDESDVLEQALDEAIEIARRSRVRLQISHCKAAGLGNHGKSAMLLDKLHAARVSGIDVRGDQYPYLAGSTMLSALLPPEALAGGVAALRDRLAVAAERDRLRAVAEDRSRTTGAGLWRQALPADVLIVKHSRAGIGGTTLAQASGDLDPWQVLCDLVAEDPGSMMVITFMAEDDVRAIMADPLISIGSDNGMPMGLEHPRTWGCFPRFIGEYVREQGIVDMPEAVRKMTSSVADQFGLAGRGWLGPGAIADISVFDPDTIGHDGTYAVPDVTPTGVRYVLLGGEVVVDGGSFTGRRAGRVLRSN